MRAGQRTGTREASGTSPRTVQTIEQVFELLELIAEAGGEASLTDLAIAVGRPRSSVHRLLQTCKTGGYVRQLPSHVYMLGPGLIPLGRSAGSQLAQVAQHLLADLVVELGESASLARHDGDQITYVAQHASPRPIRYMVEIGRRGDLHATAPGKAILATMTEASVRQILQRTGMPRRTPHTITTPDALLDDLEGIRSRGYAIDREEHELGVHCYAVTVPKPTTGIAVCISASPSRTDASFGVLAVEKLHEVAAQIIRDLRIAG